MITPQVLLPFPLAWGFSTKADDPAFPYPAPLSQVHGCGIVEAEGGIQEADGIWTQRPGVRIGVRVADCVPILLAGELPGAGPWVAALHAGWRGAVGGIFREGIRRFVAMGGSPGNLTWALGPAIQRCHFEVGPEVVQVARLDPAWRESLAKEGPAGKPHLDLHGFLKAQALDMGLSPEKDGSISLCTVCQRDLLWSYRCGDRTARQWGWVEILPE